MKVAQTEWIQKAGTVMWGSMSKCIDLGVQRQGTGTVGIDRITGRPPFDYMFAGCPKAQPVLLNSFRVHRSKTVQGHRPTGKSDSKLIAAPSRYSKTTIAYLAVLMG